MFYCLNVCVLACMQTYSMSCPKAGWPNNTESTHMGKVASVQLWKLSFCCSPFLDKKISIFRLLYFSYFCLFSLFFLGTVYNIPICLWLLDTYPFNPPICFVKPTSSMMIKTGKHIDANGKIYLPYLHEWKHVRWWSILHLHHLFLFT